MKTTSRNWLLISLALSSIVPATGAMNYGHAAVYPTPRQVLVLYSGQQLMPITIAWDRGIRSAIESGVREIVVIHSEFLDLTRLTDQAYQQQCLQLLRLKYAKTKLDAVIPVFEPAAAFVVKNRSALFADTPLVFCSISDGLRQRLPPAPTMTGVTFRLDFLGTLQLIRDLRPGTRHAVVVVGATEIEKKVESAVRNAFAGEKDVDFLYLTGLPVEELLSQVSRLSSDSAILFVSHDRDRDGRESISSRDIVARISQAANVPVFGLYDALLGHGIVGGRLTPVEEQGRRAGEITARILQGVRPGDIPFTGTEMNRDMFDCRQLKRWEIHERSLPVGSQVLFREPSLWKEHWGYIVAGSVAILLQSLLIAVLLVNRKRRLCAEVALADRLQFETVLSDLSSHFVDIAPGHVHSEIERALAQVTRELNLDRGAVFEISDDGSELQATVFSVRPGLAGAPAAMPVESMPWLWEKLCRGDTFRSAVADLPEDATLEKEVMVQLGLKSAVAVPLKAKGTILGMLVLGQLTRDQSWDDTVIQRLKVVGELVANALAHARSDEALTTSRKESRQLAGRLLTAQEDERKRLAREMHDDVSQRLAATAIEAGKFEQQFPLADPSRQAMASLKGQLISLSDDVHRISRQLHPSILDDLGLEEAIRSECDRFAERKDAVIQLHRGDVPGKLPKEIALCIYRIAQEALRNVSKHSHTDRVELVLNADPEFIYLEVRDFGCGFRSEEVRGQPGLGLASMEERARLVGGEITISSALGEGTSIAVRIPLPEEDE
jgi:two-component system, NarL family, sensor kinase